MHCQRPGKSMAPQALDDSFGALPLVPFSDVSANLHSVAPFHLPLLPSLSLSLSSPTIYLSISFFPFLSTFFHCCTKVSFSFSYIYMLIDEMKNARVLVEETQMPETLGDDDIVQGTPPRIVRSLDFSV